MRHVKSQLAGYAEGLLSANQAKRVQQHILICPDCRDALAAHEQIARDVRVALAVTPQQDQIARWWKAVQTAQQSVPIPVRQHWWASTAMLPTMLAVFVILLPMLMRLTGEFNKTAFAAGTYSAPGVVVTNLPPTEHDLQTQEPMQGNGARLVKATYASAESAKFRATDVPVLIIPAPLAP